MGYLESLAWPALWLADAGLTGLITWKIPYTEIDWKAYMEQIESYNSGVRDYSQIRGGTGPLVYPGGHVMIFDMLYGFCDNGTNIVKAQLIYMALYLITLAIVLSIYRKVKLPFYYAVFIVLSKRLHSIYVLRLFNDCWATLFVVIAVRMLLDRRVFTSALLFSCAVSVKMSALLFLPGAALVYWKMMKFRAAFLAIPFFGVQIAVWWPFKEYWREYVNGAFEFGRQFMYKWTVNWKFVPEEVFLSKQFAYTLLFGHISFLVVMALQFFEKPLTSRHIVRVVAVANAIGMLFARSLHYQFYSWLYWTVPLLMADLGWLGFPVWAALEYSWNVFPATALSSRIAVAGLAALVIGGMRESRHE